MPELCLLINSYDEIQKQLASQSNFLGCCFFADFSVLSHIQWRRYKAEEYETQESR